MGSMLRELRGHTNFIHTLTYDNHSQILCSGGLDSTAKFWDLSQAKPSQQSLLTSNSNKSVSQSSTELITSTLIDFDVYWASVDSNNVFYLAGARKTGIFECKQEQRMKSGKIEVSPAEKSSSVQQQQQPATLPPAPQTESTNKRVGVSTRKASANSKNLHTPTTTNTAATTSTTTNNPNYNFLNNDDLYEV